MLLSPGDLLDRYEVLELLGVGGVGEVYRAMDRRLGRVVALKTLRRVSSSAGRALLEEARAAGAFSHPNALTIYDVGEVRGQAGEPLGYLAMELVVGRTMRSYVGDSPLETSRRVRWLCDVARALEAAHDAGIVHGDVKPDNVMITVDDRAKLLDFGLARRSEPLSDSWPEDGHNLPTLDPRDSAASARESAAAFSGTPRYMAPEQIRGEGGDARADQFAWGAMAYELLTGQLPWCIDAGPMRMAADILTRDVTPPSMLDPRIPKRLSEAILRALSKRREDRYVSMGAVVRCLTALEDDAPPPTPSRAPAHRRRAPKSVAASVRWGVLLLALGWLAGASTRDLAPPGAHPDQARVARLCAGER